VLKQLRRSPAAGASLWEEHWREHDEIRFDRESLRWDGFLDLVDAAIGRGPILEAGCGLGRYLLYLRGQGAKAVGVDFAREPLRTVQQKMGPVPVAVAGIGLLPFPADTFGTIFCLGVIEHIEATPPPDWTFYQFCFRADELRKLLEDAGLTVVVERRIGKLFSAAGFARGVMTRAVAGNRPRCLPTCSRT
jgi:SAM-dependent methyltransferase